MMLRAMQWIWRRRLFCAGCLLLLIAVLLNVIAYNHAYAMTHFATSGVKTKNPEELHISEKARVLFTGVNLPRPSISATPASLGLRYETHHFSSSDGLELEAWHIPEPQARATILMFHGYANCKSSLLQEARAFHGMGLDVLLVDFRGCGGSSGNETTVGMLEANDVKATVNYWQQQKPDSPIILYGQSMGGAAVLRALAMHDLSLRGVVLECPFDRLLSTVESRFSAMGLPAFPNAQLLVFWGGVQHGFNGFQHNPVDYALSVRCPVLLLHGELDPRVRHEQADAIFQNLAGPKRFVVFQGVGHQSYVAARPDEWRQSVAGFLDDFCNSAQLSNASAAK
jgi:alpha-beta hydrolase superfamily lysophospholipase